MLNLVNFMNGNLEVVGPVIGFIIFYLMVQLIIFGCAYKRNLRRKKRGYHVMNKLHNGHIAVTMVTGSKKTCSLSGGKIILNLRTSDGQILELDLGRCHKHDHGIFTYGRRDTFYIGYHPSKRPKLDQIGITLVPYDKVDKSVWTCDYVYIQDSNGTRAHYFVDYSFCCVAGFAGSIFIQEEVDKSRLFLKTFYHGLATWHLWVGAFCLEAPFWQRMLPLYFALTVMAAVLSVSQGMTSIMDYVHLSKVYPLVTTFAVSVLEYVFRQVHDEDRSPCYCSSGSVKEVMKPLRHHRNRITCKGSESTFLKCVRFVDTHSSKTCTIDRRHLPGTSEPKSPTAGEFFEKVVDGLEKDIKVFSVGRSDSAKLHKTAMTPEFSPKKDSRTSQDYAGTENVAGSNVAQFVDKVISSSLKVANESGSGTEPDVDKSGTSEKHENSNSTLDGSVLGKDSKKTEQNKKKKAWKKTEQSKKTMPDVLKWRGKQQGDNRQATVMPVLVPGMGTSSAELLIKEIVERTLDDPARTPLSQRYSSTTILNLIREEMNTKGYQNENYEQLLRKHLKSIIEDLRKAVNQAGECGSPQSKYVRLMAAKGKSKQRILDMMDLLTVPGSVSSPDTSPSPIKGQRKVCSDCGLHAQKPPFNMEHTSSDSLLQQRLDDLDDGEAQELDKSKTIKTSLSVFSSLRSQKVLEKTCDHVKKVLSTRRKRFCQQGAQTGCRIVDRSKERDETACTAVPLSKKATATVLLDDVHESVMNMSRNELHEALMDSLEDLWTPEHKQMVQNSVKDLLQDSQKDFAEEFVDSVMSALCLRNRPLGAPIAQKVLASNRGMNCDPEIIPSILRFAMSLFEIELDNLEKSEDAICKFATVLQYVDTVVTNALIQADTSIRHGMACFDDIRNSSNNSNIGSKPGTLKYNILYNIVSKMADDSSCGNFSKTLFAELCARSVGNYLVFEALARAKDYIYEASETFDLDQLTTDAARLCLNPNYDITTLKDAIDTEEFVCCITHELEKTAVHHGCQVVAEQLLDFFKHENAIDALQMANALTSLKGGTLSNNYIKLKDHKRKTSGQKTAKPLLNLFDSCMSSEELVDIMNDLEGIRNINQNQRGQNSKVSTSHSVTKLSDLDVEHGPEWDAHRESHWRRRSSAAANGKEYWTLKLYQREHDQLLRPAIGHMLFCVLVLTCVLLLWFLLWVGISNSFEISWVWAEVAGIFCLMHVLIFEFVKILLASLFSMYIIKGPVH